MEDGVPEAESLLHPVNPAAAEKDGADKETGSGEDEEKESGFISNLISNLVSGRESEEKKAEEETEEKKDEEKGGGLLSNLISNLVSPVTSPKPVENGGKVEDFEIKDGTRNEDGTRSEAEEGPINSFLNHFFHQKCEGDSEKNQQEIQALKTVEKINEPVKSDEDEDGGGDGGGGGGLIYNIVSHLPEDAAPSTDEASILIHSIVHD